MTTTLNYYEILEITKTATPEQIKQSYKKLALKHHPDKNEDKQKAKVMFTQISEAYTILNDPEKRSLYDQFGTADVDSLAFNFEEFFSADFGDFQDMLNEVLFSNFAFSSFDKKLFKMEKAAKNSKGSKRAKNGGMGDLGKMLSQMMGMTQQMFGGPKSKSKSSNAKKKQQDQDDEWETDSEDENNNEKDWQDDDGDLDEDDEIPTEQELMMLPVFIQQSSTTTKKKGKKKMTCKLDEETFKSDEDLVDHFCSTHMSEFRKWAASK